VIAVSQRNRTATIGINGRSWYRPDRPFGGYEQSGIEREMDVVGFEEYLQVTSLPGPA
jgi:acyl-CoA reductase-like NAD-dependent aldehyde dehydrogenase